MEYKSYLCGRYNNKNREEYVCNQKSHFGRHYPNQ